jgi:hypothetical protein
VSRIKVPWEERIRNTDNENSQKTQFSKSLYTRFDGTREHYVSSRVSSMHLLSVTQAIKDTEDGGGGEEEIPRSPSRFYFLSNRLRDLLAVNLSNNVYGICSLHTIVKEENQYTVDS